MTQIVPRGRSDVAHVPFRLTLERIPGDRVMTGFIDVSGHKFKAWSRSGPVDEAIERLARELARHLKVARDDVDINEDDGARGCRRFRLIAHCHGKSRATTDAVAAFRAWKNSASPAPLPLPEYIDI